MFNYRGRSGNPSGRDGMTDMEQPALRADAPQSRPLFAPAPA